MIIRSIVPDHVASLISEQRKPPRSSAIMLTPMITDSVWAAGRDHGVLSGAARVAGRDHGNLSGAGRVAGRDHGNLSGGARAFRFDHGVVRRELSLSPQLGGASSRCRLLCNDNEVPALRS
jgi:hypothetical protein